MFVEQLYGPPQWREPAQAALLPVMLDEFVAPDALVRVIDDWIAALPMADLGFAESIPQRMGVPPYDRADLLRLYLQGYLNATRPSRSLKRECHRNAECVWLLGRLAPDHKTITEFREAICRRWFPAVLPSCRSPARSA